tara:strand:+ start:416 stop:1084 length:669 start_codon:yes stop_codon:yes gene_type:complete
MKIQAVLFDCDGVLLESERLLKEQIHKHLIQNYNFTKEYEEFYKDTRGQAFRDTIKYLNQHNIQAGEEFFNYVESLFIDNYKSITEKMANVDEVLFSLKDFPKAVCSNGLVELYADTLEYHGIKHHFNAFFGIETTKELKPSPEMFLQAAMALNTPIENCLIIDDSYLTGVPAGKASRAGAVVGFASDEFVEDYMMTDAGADYVIRSLDELPKIINSINSKL